MLNIKGEMELAAAISLSYFCSIQQAPSLISPEY